MTTTTSTASSASTASPTTGVRRTRRLGGGTLCAASGLVGGVLIFVVGNPLSSTAGAEITAALVANGMRLHVVAWLGALVCAGLTLASIRLGGAAGGRAGRVIAASGAAAAVLMLGYYASFAAGAGVGATLLIDPGPGLGEATLVVLNAFSLTLVGPALALVTAAALSTVLPRWVRVSAVVLAVLLLVPVTTWVANLLLPVWLGLAAARRPASLGTVSAQGSA